ncbi:MAG: thiamine diphosphokinase [Deltaproteobacteria bacterium]|nr:thiamine diphosphokinase [Deltaproteobacteria bacterium]
MNFQALIVLNGNLPSKDKTTQIFKESSYVIAADRGYQKLKDYNLTPHVTLGDFDSLKKTPQDCEVIKYESEKDKTDGELAIEYALHKKCQKIIILGFQGGEREDHVAGHYALLLKYAPQVEIEVYGETSTLYVVTHYLQINGGVGDLVSLMTFDTKGVEVKTTGLKYPLFEEKLFPGSLGLSNELVSEIATIQIPEGTLFVFHSAR